MIIIPPINVTPDILTSNVPISETAWTAGTYPVGTQRYVGTMIYEVVDLDGTSDEPITGAAKEIPTWVKVRAINRYRAFDFVIGESTTLNGDIEMEVNAGKFVDSILFFNIAASSVQVRLVDPVAGEVYNENNNLSTPVGTGNWYKFFFGQVLRQDSAIFANLPLYRDATLHITIIADGSGSAEIGEIIIGRQDILGTTMMNFTFGIEDFSRKERDTFGNFVIVERRFAKTASYDIFMKNWEVNQTFRKLAEVRATPVVFIGDPNRIETLMLGFYKNFSTLRTGPHSSEMTLEIEGLV